MSISVRKNIPSFSTGEVSPLLTARTDFEKYSSACETLENFQLLEQGGVTRRPGTRYVAATKNSAKESRLIRFKFNVSDVVILEFGEKSSPPGYIRFYKDSNGVGVQIQDGGSPYEIETPYLEGHIWDLKFFQDADVMYIVHPKFAPRKLSRAGETDWSLSYVRFDPPPSYLANTNLGVSCWIQAITGNNIPIVANQAFLRKPDVGRALIMGASRGTIDSYSSTLPATTCVLSAITGSSITFTAGAATFAGDSTDIGKSISMFINSTDTWATARITASTSTTVVTCTIMTDWPSSDDTGWTFATKTIASGKWAWTSVTMDIEEDWPGADVTGVWDFTNKTITASKWYLVGSPVCAITPSDVKPAGKKVTLVLTENNGHNVTATASGSTVTVTFTAHGLATDDYVATFVSGSPPASGAFKVTYVDANTFTYNAESAPGFAAGANNITVYRYVEGLRSIGATNIDTGKYVKIGDGIFRITSLITNDNKVVAAKARIESRVKGSARTYFAGEWSLEVRSWPAKETTPGTAESTDIFPSIVGGYQNRLILGATSNQPTTIWGSATGEYENFAIGINDDDAIDYTLTTRNKLRWLLAHRVILVGTDGEEIMLGVEGNKALTATNVRAIMQSNLGGSNVSPLMVNNSVLFLQRSGNKLWEYTYSFDDDVYKGIGLTILAENIATPLLNGIIDPTATGIVDMDFQKEPNPTVWCVRSDGQLLALLYNQNENLTGWSRFITGQLDDGSTNGWFESVCVEPISNRERVWVIVNRLVNGSYVRYVEYFEDAAWIAADGWQCGQMQTDCALKRTGAPTTSITGLGHLEGKLVNVIGDGILQANKTVVSGAITITSASKVEVGLPFASIGLTVRPEVLLGDGSSQGRVKGWSELVVRLYRSMAGYINDQPMEYYLVDSVKTAFTGDYKVHNLGHDIGGRVSFRQYDPLPMTVLGISGKLTIGT